MTLVVSPRSVDVSLGVAQGPSRVRGHEGKVKGRGRGEVCVGRGGALPNGRECAKGDRNGRNTEAWGDDACEREMKNERPYD